MVDEGESGDENMSAAQSDRIYVVIALLEEKRK